MFNTTGEQSSRESLLALNILLKSQWRLPNNEPLSTVYCLRHQHVTLRCIISCICFCISPFCVGKFSRENPSILGGIHGTVLNRRECTSGKGRSQCIQNRKLISQTRMLQEESRPEINVLQKQPFLLIAVDPVKCLHVWIIVALIHTMYCVHSCCINHTVIYIKNIRRRCIMNFIPMQLYITLVVA